MVSVALVVRAMASAERSVERAAVRARKSAAYPPHITRPLGAATDVEIAWVPEASIIVTGLLWAPATANARCAVTAVAGVLPEPTVEPVGET